MTKTLISSLNQNENKKIRKRDFFFSLACKIKKKKRAVIVISQIVQYVFVLENLCVCLNV